MSQSENEVEKFSELQVTHLKASIISRKPFKQRAAIKFIIENLKSNDENSPDGEISPRQLSRVIQLLDANFAESLSEIIGTIDYNLLGDILQCFKYFSKCPKFYEDNHSNHVLISILRIIPYLLDQHNSSKVVYQLLQLIHIIILKFCNDDLKKSTCFQISLIVTRCQHILKRNLNEDLNIQTIFILLQTMHYLRNNIEITVDVKDVDILIECCKVVFEMVVENKIDNMTLLCQFGTTVMKVQKHLTSILNDTENNATNLQEKMFITILKFIKESASAYILNLPILKNHWPLYEAYLNCLRKLYKAALHCEDLFFLSRELIDNGILKLMKIYSSLSPTNKSTKIIVTLNELLLNLSQSDLDVANVWFESIEAFKNHLKTGLQNLPRNICLWPNQSDLSTESCHVVIIFSYFYSINFGIINNDSFLNWENVIKYMKQLRVQDDFPKPIIKALWLTFCVAWLSKSDTTLTPQCADAINIMVRLVAMISCHAFTKHRALLHWAFSVPGIPVKLQTIVIYSWIQSDDTNNETNAILDQLVASNETIAACVMNMIQTAPSHLVKKVITVVHNAIKLQDQENFGHLRQAIWNWLPQTLTNLKDYNTTQAANTALLLNLASMCVPPDVSKWTVFQVISRIIPFLTCEEQSSVLLESSLQICCSSLLISDDNMPVLDAFINNKQIIDIIIKHALTEKFNIKQTCICILCNLIIKQEQSSLLCTQERQLSLRESVQLTVCDDTDESYNFICLHFLYALLIQRIPRPVIRIPLEPEIVSKFVQTAYLNCLMLCAKGPSKTSSISWRCLAALLDYTAKNFKNSSIHKHIVSEPFNHVLLTTTLSKKICNYEHSQELLMYLYSLLNSKCLIENSYPVKVSNVIKTSRINKTFWDKTLFIIANSFIDGYFFIEELSEPETEQVNKILEMILLSSNSLSTDQVVKLKSLKQGLIMHLS